MQNEQNAFVLIVTASPLWVLISPVKLYQRLVVRAVTETGAV